MKVEVIADLIPIEDVTEYLGRQHPGLYIINDSLHIVDKNKSPFFLWGNVKDYIDYKEPKTSPTAEITTEVEITSDGITPELLLQAIAVTQKPELAFK